MCYFVLYDLFTVHCTLFMVCGILFDICLDNIEFTLYNVSAICFFSEYKAHHLCFNSTEKGKMIVPD